MPEATWYEMAKIFQSIQEMRGYGRGIGGSWNEK